MINKILQFFKKEEVKPKSPQQDTREMKDELPLVHPETIIAPKEYKIVAILGPSEYEEGQVLTLKGGLKGYDETEIKGIKKFTKDGTVIKCKEIRG